MAGKRGAYIRTAPIDHRKAFGPGVVDGRTKAALHINATRRGYTSLLGHRPNAIECEQINVAAVQRYLISLAEADACNVGQTDPASYLAMVQDHDKQLARLGLLRAPAPIAARPVESIH